jgi:MoxR-like ATPase
VNSRYLGETRLKTVEIGGQLSQVVNVEYLNKCIAVAVCVEARVAVILWGAPGQGKTSVLKSFADQSGRKLEIILASIREPQDFAGLPAISNGTMSLIPPNWAQSLATDGNGILFADEINTAPPSVQAALLRVCLEKVAGDLDLGAGTSIVAAANPPEIAADGWDLAPPLANRFCHIDWELPGDVVAAGLVGNWPRVTLPTASEDDIEKETRVEAWKLAGFLSARPELATAMPDSTGQQGRAFPTPRSWEFVVKLVSLANAMGLSAEVKRLLVVGCVGQGAGSEYLSFRENMDLPSPETIISDPENVDLPVRADQLYVICGSVHNALANNFSIERWDNVGKFILRLSNIGHPDIAVSLLLSWKKLAPVGALISRPIGHALNPLIQEAGLLE